MRPRSTGAALVAAGVLLGVAFASAQDKGPRVVEAEEIVLKDKAGHVRMRLSIEDERVSRLRMTDAAGKTRLLLQEGGGVLAGVWVMDEEGAPAVVVRAGGGFKAAQPGVSVQKDNQIRAEIGLQQLVDGHPAQVILRDKDGKDTFKAP